MLNKFRNRPYSYFYDKIVKENKDIYKHYNSNYERIKNNHSVFSKGWSCNFFLPPRYMNWIIYAYITETINKDQTIFDIGTYDGMLVKVLLNQGYNVYGWNYSGYTTEELNWDEMYNFLNIKDRINIKFEEKPNIVIMFDYHHNFKPDDLFSSIRKTCFGQLPDTAFFDREETNGHPYNKLYYNADTLKNLGIKIVNFPECEKSGVILAGWNWDITKRELMIWDSL